jgi:hypothetical protein
MLPLLAPADERILQSAFVGANMEGLFKVD